MKFRPARGYSLSMFVLASLCLLGGAALANGEFVSDNPSCTLAFCLMVGILLVMNGLAVLGSSIGIGISGVEIKCWFRNSVIPWSEVEAWSCRKEMSGDFKGRFFVRFCFMSGQAGKRSILDVKDWEVKRPGFESFLEALRGYCGSKEIE
jgi:hypothetical protein